MLRESMKLGRVVPIGFGTIFALMVGVGVASKLSMNVLVESIGWVNHTHEVKAHIQELETIVTKAETGQRGFIYTGKEEFLDPYTQATATLDETLSQLRSDIKNE